MVKAPGVCRRLFSAAARLLIAAAVVVALVGLVLLLLLALTLLPYRLRSFAMAQVSEDGSLLAIGVTVETVSGLDVIGNADEIRLMDMRRERVRRVLAVPKGFLGAMRFGPGSQQLASYWGIRTRATESWDYGDLVVWDLSSGQIDARRRIHSDARYQRLLELSPDGTRFVDWDTRAEEVRLGHIDGSLHVLVRRAAGRQYAAAFSAAGAILSVAVLGPRILMGDAPVWRSTVINWTVTPLRELGRFELDGDVSLYGLSPDGRVVAAGRQRETSKRGIGVWDSRTGAFLREFAMEGFTNALAFSPDGRMLAGSLSTLNEVRVWSVSTGHLVQRYSIDPKEVIIDVAFLRRGGGIIAVGRSALYFLDLQTGQSRKMPVRL